jgi:hypothetical protein
MEINELIGYKQNPIYLKAKAIYNPHVVARAQGYDKRDRRIIQMEKFTEFLSQHGFKKLGSGSFGTVYEKPGYPWIFKIFLQDPAYLTYLKYAIANQSNSSVPRIKGRIIKINTSTYAIRMEKLKPITILTRYSEFTNVMSHYDYNEERPQDEEFLRITFPSILQILNDLKKNKWEFDLSTNNVMARDKKTPVLVDPIFDPKGMNEEQLNELKGYKTHPIYQKTKSTFDPETINAINDVTLWKRREYQIKEFSRFLANHGFKQLGIGAYSGVYEKPGYPWVFKVFNNDPSYLYYLKYVMQHQSNPNVPKIKGNLLKINDDTYAIRMEKLKPIRSVDSNTPEGENVQLLIDKLSYRGTDDQRWIKEYFHGVYEILKYLDLGPWPYDLHSGNILSRGNVPVISDPVYNPKGLDEADRAPRGLGWKKSNPVFQFSKGLFNPNDVNDAILTGKTDYRDVRFKKFTEFMKQYGFVELGTGSFGAVYEKPGYPWVFKLFHRDPAYLTYLKYVMANQSNPAVPKIKGNVLKINDDTYAIRMEKLTKLPRPIPPNVKQILQIISYTNKFSELSEENKKWLATYEPNIYKIVKAMGSFYDLDIGINNIMMRGNQVVIVDPVVDEDYFEESQLNELTGYKQHPVYQKAKELFDPYALVKSKGYYKDERRRTQLYRFYTFLATHGFKELGMGTFAGVYEKPGYPWMFKVFNDDPAYMMYLKYAIQHQSNPNVPKIKGNLLKINDETYAVRMEKLDNFDSGLGDLQTMYFIINVKRKHWTNEDINWLKKYYPGILQIIDDLNKIKKSFEFDLHSGNIMLRGKTPVIVDPMVDPVKLNESELNELIGYHNHPIYKTANISFDPATYPRNICVSDKLNDFTDKLIKLGYNIRVKGTGRAGTVFKRPDDPYVIKVFHKDMSYLEYLHYAMEHQDNPHVPKIRGKIIKINSNTFAIRIEELYPIRAKNGHEQDLIDSLVSTQDWGDFRQNDYIELEAPRLYELLSDLAILYGSRASTDLTSSNIMNRSDGTIVITDPA